MSYAIHVFLDCCTPIYVIVLAMTLLMLAASVALQYLLRTGRLKPYRYRKS